MTAHHDDEEFTGGWSAAPWRALIRHAPGHGHLLAGMAVLSVGMAVFDTGFTLLTKAIFDDLAAPGGGHWRVWTGLYAALVVLFSVGIWGFIRIGARISTRLSHDIRRAAFARLQELSFAYYDHRPVGWLVTRLTSDCDRLARIFSWGMLDLVWGTFFLVFIAVAMLALNWRLALIVLSVLPLLAAVSLLFQRGLLRTSRQARRVNSRITAGLGEAIMGVRTTRTLVREAENLREFQTLTDEMYVHSVRNAILNAAYWPSTMALGGVAVALALWAGGGEAQLGAAAGGISLGTLVAFVSYARQFFMPVQELARVLADLQQAQAAAERVAGLLDAVPQVCDSAEVRARIAAQRFRPRVPGTAGDGLPDRIDTVEFAHVAFGYVPDQPVLRDFSFTARRGQTIALVGPTGGGKTTIVSLLCRFYEPSAGQIRFDGIEYRERSLEWLQSRVGVVLQTPHAFSGTVRENIRFGRLDATDAEVETAARRVCAHDVIAHLPNGYETLLGEGGQSLSVGQKQLVSLARAVLTDPLIFVMDEATSSLDTETERAIQQGLRQVLAGRLSFVIAHRLSTIRSADRIVVIRDGGIVEQGSHHDLIATRGEYHELYTAQFTRQRTEEVLAGAPALA